MMKTVWAVHFKVEHSKFYNPNFGDFEVVNFTIGGQQQL